MMKAPTAPGLVEQFSSLQIMLDAHRPGTTSSDAIDSVSTIPVVLLAGFLGAGKSSLLVSLLQHPPQDCRIQAVVNDVGSLPLDPTLVQLRNDVQVELTNGCACCQSSFDLGAALDTASDADLIVLEASGLADPHALAHVVHARPGLVLDRIVTVVDATAFTRQMADPALAPLASRQLDAAHSVIVTKADRVGESDLDTVVDELALRAPGRIISASTLSEPAVGALLPSAPRGARLPADESALAHGVATITFDQHRPVPRTQIEATYAAQPYSIVRTKGIVVTGANTFLVQSSATDHAIAAVGAESQPARLTISGTDSTAILRFAAELGFALPS